MQTVQTEPCNAILSKADVQDLAYVKYSEYANKKNWWRK